MRILAVVLTVVSGLYVIDCVKLKSNLHHCGRHRFFNETSSQCESCDLCGPGTYVESKCKGSRDTTCRNCPSGYFSITYSRSPNLCRRCNDCGTRKVVSRCTSKSDAKCGECPLGTYWNYVKYTCTPCSYCFPEYGEHMAIEPSCENPQIPSTHRCAEGSWTPYKPPPLILQVNQETNLILSKDVGTTRFKGVAAKISRTRFKGVAAKISRTISTNVGSTGTTSPSSHTSSTENSNASIDEVISKFTELYNVHCSRTLIFAGIFCLCVVFTALIGLCVIRKKRPQYSQV